VGSFLNGGSNGVCSILALALACVCHACWLRLHELVAAPNFYTPILRLSCLEASRARPQPLVVNQGGATGQLPLEIAKICLVVRYNIKLRSFCPTPKICGPSQVTDFTVVTCKLDAFNCHGALYFVSDAAPRTLTFMSASVASKAGAFTATTTAALKSKPPAGKRLCRCFVWTSALLSGTRLCAKLLLMQTGPTRPGTCARPFLWRS